MNAVPRLSIGLPVYNGERYLGEALDSLLRQSYSDIELVISDNASSDNTETICRRYAAKDSRVRYFRQPSNIGASPNHNFVFEQSRGELFKWASHDDLYDPQLLQRCVETLDANPDAVLVHSWTAVIDPGRSDVARALTYPLSTSSQSVVVRFSSMLFDDGGDDDYGVVRADVLRRTHLYDSYWRADRTIIAEVALYGRFVQVPEWLYFRRNHKEQVSHAPNVRTLCSNYDARRANRIRHPRIRLLAGYPWGYAKALHTAPLSSADRRRCYGLLLRWLASRTVPSVRLWLSRPSHTPTPPTPCRSPPSASAEPRKSRREREG